MGYGSPDVSMVGMGQTMVNKTAVGSPPLAPSKAPVTPANKALQAEFAKLALLPTFGRGAPLGQKPQLTAVPGTNWQNDGSGVAAYYMTINGQRYIYMPNWGRESSGGDFRINDASAQKLGGIPVTSGLNPNMAGMSGNGYLFATDAKGQAVGTGGQVIPTSSLRGFTGYTPGRGGTGISDIASELGPVAAVLAAPIAGALLAPAAPAAGAAAEAAAPTAAEMGAVGGMEIPAGTTAGGLAASAATPAAALGATGAEIAPGAMAAAGGATGGIGAGAGAAAIDTAALPAGAAMDAAGNVTLANGVALTSTQASQLGAAGMASLSSAPADVATQALATSAGGAGGGVAGGGAAGGLPASVTTALENAAKKTATDQIIKAATGGGGETTGGGMATSGNATLDSLAKVLGIDPSSLSSIANIGLTAAQEAILANQIGATKAAYAKTPQDIAAEQYQAGLAGAATALQQGPTNPQFQALMASQKNLIMQGIQQSVTTMRNANNEQIARSGIGFLNPERRDETMARTLAASEESAQAQAQQQVMQALQGAVTAGTGVSQTLATQGALERSSNIAQNNAVSKLQLAQAQAPLPLINTLFGTNVQPIGSTGSTSTATPTPTTSGTATGTAGVGGLISGAVNTAKNFISSLSGPTTPGTATPSSDEISAVGGLEIPSGTTALGLPSDASSSIM